MPKRPFPDDEDVDNSIKNEKQKRKIPKVRSSSAERTLERLYQGSNKFYSHKNQQEEKTNVCVRCLRTENSAICCSFCEELICWECRSVCYKCKQEYCGSCSYLTYDVREAVCFSCS